MAILHIPADRLISDMMGNRKNTVTLNNLAFDPVTRVATLEIVGAEVPDAREVTLELNFRTQQWFLKAKP